MNTSEAKNIVGSLKNHYQAFEKLEEALTIIDQQARILDNYEGKKTTLSKEVVALEDKVKERKDQLEKIVAEYGKTSNDLAKGVKEKKGKIANEIKNVKAQAQGEIDQVHSDLDNAKKAHDHAMKEMTTELRSTTGALKKAKQDYDNFKASIA